MPMTFDNQKTLDFAAKAHGFRSIEPEETEANYRLALAKYVLPRDRIEAFEIKFGVGWDLWTADQKGESLFGSM